MADLVDLTQITVRILGAHDASVGSGFVVSQAGLIITCAHVVESTGAQPGGSVRLAFQATGEIRTANVLAEAWKSPENEDVAILQVEGDLPSGIGSVTLGESIGCDGHQFRTFGYPRLGRIEGVWATGEIKGHVRQADGRRLLQIASAELAQGMSGAPVLDLARGQVIGMVAEVYYPDQSLKLWDTALATPCEVFQHAFPSLMLQPAPLRDLLVTGGRLYWPRLLSRQVLAALALRFRRLLAARPLWVALSLLGLLIVAAFVISAVRAYQNREWREVWGGQAILGTAEHNCQASVSPFEIQITEVTNAAYLQCVRAKVCELPRSIWVSSNRGPIYPAGLENHPVFGVTWQNADAYCRFIGARLPTEAEWVRAARGGSTRQYPWGDEFDTARANVFESGIGDTVEVFQYPDGRNADGLFNLSGNVREWVADNAIDSCDFTRGTGAHVARGGSFTDRFEFATLWSRAQGDDLPYVGIRCVRDMRP